MSVNFRVERPKGMYVGKGLIDCTTQRIWQGAIGAQVSGTLALVLPCPRPPGWSLMGPVVACTTGANASALSSTFSVARAGVALPVPCIPSRVQSNVRALLTSFNNGLGGALARRFVARGRFHPYTGSVIGGRLIGRRAVASFVRTRYNAGDGWTASRLAPPQGPAGLPDHAVYGLMFAVTYQGTLIAAEAAAKLVVDCRSGLLRRWVGPSIKIPGS